MKPHVALDSGTHAALDADAGVPANPNRKRKGGRGKAAGKGLTRKCEP